MSTLLLLIAGIVAVTIGFAIGRKSKHDAGSAGDKNDVAGEHTPAGPAPAASRSRLAQLLPRARQALSRRTEKRKTMILEMLRGEARHMQRLTQCNIDPAAEGLTSDDVSLLLRVSRNTARSYLNELEEENKILQIGAAGPGVHYVLKDKKA